MKRERPSSFRQKASSWSSARRGERKTKRARRLRSAAFFDTRQSVRICFRDDTSRASAWAEAGACDVPPFHFHLEHRGKKKTTEASLAAHAEPNLQKFARPPELRCRQRRRNLRSAFRPLRPKRRSGRRARRTREAHRARVAGCARREKSVYPAGDTGSACGSVESRGARGGGCGRLSASPPKPSDSCLPARDPSRNTRRRWRAARRAARRPVSDAAGARVSATRSDAATERAIRYAPRVRSRSIGTDRGFVPKPRAVSRTNKRARSLARAPGRADPPPPPFHSRRLSSRAAPSRDTRADSRASPRPRLDPPRAPRTRAGPVAAPSTWLIPPSRVSR